MSVVKVRKRNEWTHEESMDVIEQILAAGERGDEAEYKRLIRLFPLPAYLAKFAKEQFGKDYVLNMGFDLSEAEERYGANWLDA